MRCETGCRFGKKGTLQAAAFEAAIANYMAPALPALVDACRDEASYTSMKSEMVIYACRYKGFWLTHNMDDLVTDETMLYSSAHYLGTSRPGTCNKDLGACAITGGPSNRVHLHSSAFQGQGKHALYPALLKHNEYKDTSWTVIDDGVALKLEERRYVLRHRDSGDSITYFLMHIGNQDGRAFPLDTWQG